MACTITNNSSRGYIYETILKIDQMQKAANVETACEGCEGSLVSAFYNTKPVVFYMCNGNKLTVDVPDTNQTTSVFRIENVRSDSVILRLLTETQGEYTCTNSTVVLSIDCICCLQCLKPICCPECTKLCGQN